VRQSVIGPHQFARFFEPACNPVLKDDTDPLHDPDTLTEDGRVVDGKRKRLGDCEQFLIHAAIWIKDPLVRAET